MIISWNIAFGNILADKEKNSNVRFYELQYGHSTKWNSFSVLYGGGGDGGGGGGGGAVPVR